MAPDGDGAPPLMEKKDGEEGGEERNLLRARALTYGIPTNVSIIPHQKSITMALFLLILVRTKCNQITTEAVRGR